MSIGSPKISRRHPGCSPMSLGVPMWQRRLGFFLGHLGNWIAGWQWGEDHYCRALMDMREMRVDQYDYDPRYPGIGRTAQQRESNA